jgi:hypothetical protein
MLYLLVLTANQTTNHQLYAETKTAVCCFQARTMNTNPTYQCKSAPSTKYIKNLSANMKLLNPPPPPLIALSANSKI